MRVATFINEDPFVQQDDLNRFLKKLDEAGARLHSINQVVYQGQLLTTVIYEDQLSLTSAAEHIVTSIETFTKMVVNNFEKT